MKKFISIIFLAVIFPALFLTSCDNQKAGTFAVKFSWAKDGEGKEVKPDVSTGEFFVTVRIYEWKEGVTFPGDIAANGKQLTQSDSAQMKATGTSIDFGDLSYGSRRFVVAEIRKGEELTNSVLFTGMSKLFDFEPGKHTEVNVEMKLTPTPGVDEEGNRIDAELRIVDDNGNLRSYTSGNDLKVKLRLLNAVSFTHVYFANKEENIKTANGKSHKIGELKKIEDVENGYELDGDWDLSFGLTADEIAVSPELKVYARLENEYGTGLLVMAKIALDNQKPELTLGLNPAYTNGSKAITLNISANELIKHDTLNIQTTNSKLIFDCPSPTKNESLSFTCTLETLDATLTDGSYEITVTATDQAGNKAEGKTGLMIDRLEPEITFEVFKNSIKVKDGIIYLKENDELELQMTLSETGVPKVQLGGENIDCVETEDRTYTCKTTIKAEIYDEGISDLTVRYEDSAGNLFNQPVVTGIRIDYTGPGLSGDATVVVAKPAGCPLSSVTAAIGGSSVDVSFIVNEILAGDPVVRAVKDTDVVPLVLDSQIGYFYSFTAENIDTGSIADGTYAIEIELVDESGNHSKTVSSSFNIMTVKPAAPAVDVADTIIYRRIPWGSDATGGIKYYGIKAGADAVDVNAVWVYAYDGSDPATASEIGK
ncbi:MAG TPA: Ig-like domain-containing protein, partial [bacterium]|nr:Ig-like domain-containing protein [bacterium]